MDVMLLGTAAGGGFPQWNCWCPVCHAARETPSRARSRTQSSVAVRAAGGPWFLLDASPDVRAQVATLPTPSSGARVGYRRSPIAGIVLTDAELDHTLGIPLLREGRHLTIYATRAVREIVECDSRLLPTTRAFAAIELRELGLGAPITLSTADSGGGLEVTAFSVAGDPPRFAQREAEGHTVALMVRDPGTGGVLAFAPGCGALTEDVLSRFAAADLALVDGTCWRDDELVSLGISDVRATDMGHVPISGEAGSLHRLAALRPRTRVVYTHLNNTNPVLLEDSDERHAVTAAGIEVGMDGMTFTL